MTITISDGRANVLDGANGEPCDEDGTLDAFAEEVCDALRSQFPGVDFEYRWENSNADMRLDASGRDDVSEEMEEAAGDASGIVYERGTFWRFPATADADR